MHAALFFRVKFREFIVMSNLPRSLALIAWLLSVATCVGAQQDDPIQLSADRGEVDYARKISRYSGNVELNQGAMTIRGDVLSLYFDAQNRLLRMAIEGTPARFEQSAADPVDALKTQATTIAYELQPQRKLRLTGDAEFWQGPNRFNGETIEYDFKTDMVRAAGGGAANSRVNVTIFPQAPRTDEERP